jgi:transcriptional regulator with XRE-family HTH domain
MNFSENLKSEMDFQNVSVKELSARTQISRNTLEKYLFGQKAVPGAENAYKIAKNLNVTVEFLLTGRDEFLEERNSKEFLNLEKKYNALNQFNRRTVMDLVDSLSARQE